MIMPFLDDSKVLFVFFQTGFLIHPEGIPQLLLINFQLSIYQRIVKRTAATFRGLQQSFYRYSFRMGTDSSCASSSSERMVLEIKKPLGVRYHRPSSLMPV